MCKRNLKKLALNLSLPRNGNVAPNPTISMPHSYNSTKDTGMQESTSNVYQHGPACILPNLYLGACYNALNVTQLTHHGITCIINVASEIRIIAPLPHIDYHHIKWTHSQHNLAISEFDRAVDTIRSAHKHHRIVLIHCQQGIERSAALILAFLLKSTRCMKRIDTTIMMDSGIFAGQNWSLDRALEFVKDKAPNIRPNMELLYQLREYEQSIPTQQQQLVEKRHNIQTRARGSATVVCSKQSSRNSLSPSFSSSQSLHKAAHKQRPRSASLQETPSASFSTTNTTAIAESDDEQPLTIAIFIVGLLVMYQRECLSSTSNYHRTIGTRT